MSVAIKLEVEDLIEAGEAHIRQAKLVEASALTEAHETDAGAYHRDAFVRIEKTFSEPVISFATTYPKYEFSPLVELGIRVAARLSGRKPTVLEA